MPNLTTTLTAYKSLNPQERQFVDLVGRGLSVAKAARTLGLNQTRLMKKPAIQTCLEVSAAPTPQKVDAVHAQRKGVGFDYPEDEAVWAFHAAIDRVEGNTGNPGDSTPSDEATYAAETVVRESFPDLARRVELKYLPDLVFRGDHALEAAGRVEELLRSPEVARDLK